MAHLPIEANAVAGSTSSGVFAAALTPGRLWWDSVKSLPNSSAQPRATLLVMDTAAFVAVYAAAVSTAAMLWQAYTWNIARRPMVRLRWTVEPLSLESQPSGDRAARGVATSHRKPTRSRRRTEDIWAIAAHYALVIRPTNLEERTVRIVRYALTPKDESVPVRADTVDCLVQPLDAAAIHVPLNELPITPLSDAFTVDVWTSTGHRFSARVPDVLGNTLVREYFSRYEDIEDDPAQTHRVHQWVNKIIRTIVDRAIADAEVEMKEERRSESGGRCAECGGELSTHDSVVVRLDDELGYAPWNSRVVHVDCVAKTKAEAPRRASHLIRRRLRRLAATRLGQAVLSTINRPTDG